MRSTAFVRVVFLTSVFLCFAVSASYAAAQAVDGEVLVRARKGQHAAFRALASQHGLSTKKTIDRIGYSLMKLPPGLTVDEAIEKLSRHPAVEYVGPNSRIRLATAQEWPNDPVFYDGYDILDFGILIAPPQWGLYNDGINQSAYYTTLPGKLRADIHAPEAWAITMGNPSVVIAVIDTGVDHWHPDLEDNVLLPGYNSVDENSDTMDDNGHGTFTAGVCAANTNNYIGIAGVAPNCKILPVKVIDSTGYGTEADGAEGVVWAVDHGAKVLNMSFAADINEPALEAAIDYAWQQGCISICASGNENVNTPMYPAYYENAVAVGATNQYDKRCTASDWGSGGSNYGPHLDIAAPGNEITSTWSDPEPIVGQIYMSAPGTSAAAPFVAGVCALVWSAHPEWTNSQVVNQVLHSADDVETPGWDQLTGWGRVNAYRALSGAGEPVNLIGDLGSRPDGTFIDFTDKVITAGSGQITNMVYIEEPDRSAGIMVDYPSGVPSGFVPGERVRVVGSLSTTAAGERTIVGATLTEISAGAALLPVGITNRHATDEAAELTRGLLVRVWGRVTEVGWTHIYIDDGSGNEDGISSTGLRIEVPNPSAEWEGRVAVVTGLLGLFKPSGVTTPVPVVRPRKPGDIRVLPL